MENKAFAWTDSVGTLPGVGPKRREALAALGIETVADLLYHMPMRYEDRRFVTKIARVRSGVPATVCGVVASLHVRKANRRNVYIATLEIADDTASVRVVLFGGPHRFAALKEGGQCVLYGVPSDGPNGVEFANPDYAMLADDDPAAVSDWARIFPIYPTTAAIPRKFLSALIYRCATAQNPDTPEPLPQALIRKYDFPTLAEALRCIHAPRTPEEALRGRDRLLYQEFYELQYDLARERAARTKAAAPGFSAGDALQRRLVESLPFPLSFSQQEAIREISADLDNLVPMHRLLQGDVGSGKTLVAIAAAARCVGAGYQAAVLVPTTVLSNQFYEECVRYLAPLGVRCAEITGATTKRVRDELLWDLRDGRVDLLVGTHALLEDSIAFRSLGLVVIDEQHRFGVRQRERMAAKSEGVHILMMSATPIPRTLCMAYYGDIDATVIREKPPGRIPVRTKIMSDNHIGELYAFLAERASKGERIYWVCPQIGEGADEDESDDTGGAVASVASRAADIERHLPGIRVGRLHGRMDPPAKREAIRSFEAGEVSLLVSTTVIEVGVHVEAASIIVIESASAFGLAQLHQLRGRVGRGRNRGICILLDTGANLRNNERLHVLVQSDDGFEIAEADLASRGAGELTGLRQHGDMNFRIANKLEDFKVMESVRTDIDEILQIG